VRMVQGVPTITDFEEAVKSFASVDDFIAFDIETGGLRIYDPVYVVSMYHPSVGAAVVQVNDDPKRLRLLLEGKRLAGHNIAAFDTPFLLHRGVTPKAIYDTLIAERVVLRSGRRDVKADLALVLKRRLRIEIDKNIVDHTSWGSELTEDMLAYCVNDVQHILRLVDAQVKVAAEVNKTDALVSEMETAMVVAYMCARGMPVDRNEYYRLLTESRRLSEQLRQELADEGLSNPNSPTAVVRWLAARGVPVSDSRADTLEDIVSSPSMPEEAKEAVRRVLEAREARKRTMYDEEWWEKYVDPDHRVRSRFWQIGADTGRFSSSEPNLQQIPRSHRAMFRAPEGRVFIVADYSQIEIFVAAALSGEWLLLESTVSGDVHSEVAQAVFGSVTKATRQAAKAASFTLIFGGGVSGLRRAAHQLGVELSETQAMHVKSMYFARYPRLAAWVRKTVSRVDAMRRLGAAYVVTTGKYGVDRALFGDSLTPTRVLNTAVQGTAAVGLKRALRRLYQLGLAPVLCAVVHDEIVAEVREDENPEEIRDAIIDAMKVGMVEALAGHGIDVPPPRVEAAITKSWVKE
jgi:DNA polymerase-1